MLLKFFVTLKTDFLLIIDWFLGGLSDIWLVCEWFGWFLGGLTGLWLVWLVCEWFRVLQLTLWNYTHVDIIQKGVFEKIFKSNISQEENFMRTSKNGRKKNQTM